MSNAQLGGGSAGGGGAWIGQVLLGLAVLLWFGYQTIQLSGERGTLQQTHAQQEPMLQNASKMRAQLDALAAATQKLADGGNQNAKLIVEELKKRGVSINANPPAATP